MELLFNELSINLLSSDKYSANSKMVLFAKTVSIARQKGFANIRSHHATSQIALAQDYSLHDWLNNKDVPEEYRNFLYGMITLPFIKDDDEDVEEKYVNANYFFEDLESGIPKTECIGLASAFLYETLSISLTSLPVWERTKLPILIEEEERKVTESVFNLSTKESFNDFSLAAFVESLEEINLVETTINPDEKNIHLTDHHGKKELKALWAKLKKCPYVVEAMSTNWGGKKFIRKAFANGEIEIVDINSDEGYALWVKTTGRNLRETNAIAEIIKGHYS